MDVLCKSVGVLLAEVRAGGAGALSQGPAEAVATLLTGADRVPPSGVDQTWLPVHGPVGPGDKQIQFRTFQMEEHFY